MGAPDKPELDVVLEGMEILSWQYDAREWGRHMAAESDLVRLETALPDLGRHATLRPVGEHSPRVLITTTGVAFGDEARLWRGARYRIKRVAVIRGTPTVPTYLVLSFAGRRRPADLHVPVPDALVKEATQLADWLREKILGHPAPD